MNKGLDKQVRLPEKEIALGAKAALYEAEALEMDALRKSAGYQESTEWPIKSSSNEWF